MESDNAEVQLRIVPTVIPKDHINNLMVAPPEVPRTSINQVAPIQISDLVIIYTSDRFISNSLCTIFVIFAGIIAILVTVLKLLT
jgi:hypothetical protein